MSNIWLWGDMLWLARFYQRELKSNYINRFKLACNKDILELRGLHGLSKQDLEMTVNDHRSLARMFWHSDFIHVWWLLFFSQKMLVLQMSYWCIFAKASVDSIRWGESSYAISDWLQEGRQKTQREGELCGRQKSSRKVKEWCTVLKALT